MKIELLMEMRTPKCPAVVDSKHWGCTFGFRGIFDFYHGRSCQNLLLNDSHGSKTLTGTEQTRSKFEIHNGFSENYQRINKKHKKAKNGARIIEDQNPSREMSPELSSHGKGFCNQIPLTHVIHSSTTRIKHYQLQKTSKDQTEVCKQTRGKSFWKRVVKSRYVYPNNGKKNQDPSKSLGILKPHQNNTQSSQKERSSIRPEKSTISYPKRGESDIFVEARKHLSERLRKVEMFEAVLRKQTPRTLERVLLSSPKHEKNNGSVSVQMRFCPYGNQLAYEGSLQTEKEKRTFKLDDPYMICDSSSKGYMKILEAPQEQNSTETTKILEENRCSDQLRKEAPSENRLPRFSRDISSSSAVDIRKLQITSRDQDREENPSPVSTLDAFFMDDAGSPTSTITESEPPLQPLHLDFDEHPELCLSSKTMDNETISGYIKKVYQTSQLDWDDFLVKGWSSESSCDQKLLYDCIKEVLVNLHQFYFSSFIKSEIQAIPTEENVVNIVMKEVESYTTPRITLYTLDILMGRYIAESGKWVDIRSDTDDIVTEIVEETLEYMILEMILDIQTIQSAHFKGSRLLSESLSR